MKEESNVYVIQHIKEFSVDITFLYYRLVHYPYHRTFRIVNQTYLTSTLATRGLRFPQ